MFYRRFPVDIDLAFSQVYAVCFEQGTPVDRSFTCGKVNRDTFTFMSLAAWRHLREQHSSGCFLSRCGFLKLPV
ncbi:hypothetical protein BC89_28425 [Pseudomonas monteilii]|nr:hypothetical protein BC89_28425 [Pseudomonas monteilii]